MMTIDEMIAVLVAAKEKKVIQVRIEHRGEWEDSMFPSWDFFNNSYRVKPAPREFWINLYGDDLLPAAVHTSAEVAQRMAGPGCTATVHVREVEETRCGDNSNRPGSFSRLTI